MAVEKIDLKSLFAPVCAPFRIPIRNVAGWSDITRAAMMKRFAYWEARGKKSVLLYFGDFDPAASISQISPGRISPISKGAVGWSPDNLIIDRFGLNFDFIQAQRLTWIDNLETSKGDVPLDDPRHRDHMKLYVADYVAQFGARKCEANSLVMRPAAGRQLCREAILRYLPEGAPAAYRAALAEQREAVRLEVRRLLAEGALDDDQADE
jgi:hypothetical protein